MRTSTGQRHHGVVDVQPVGAKLHSVLRPGYGRHTDLRRRLGGDGARAGRFRVPFTPWTPNNVGFFGRIRGFPLFPLSVVLNITFWANSTWVTFWGDVQRIGSFGCTL